MTKKQLIGTWKRDGLGQWIHLHADGSALCEVLIPSQPIHESDATWKWVSPKRWQLRLRIDPQSDNPSLKEGGTEVIDYRIITSSPGHMACAVYDYEHPFEVHQDFNGSGRARLRRKRL